MADVKLKRNTFIGGSDVASILGLNRYKTPYEVWEEKKHGIRTFEGNQATEWGTKLEPVIVDHCQKEHGWNIECRNDKLISKFNPIFGCHPDGLMICVEEIVLVEAKTVSSQAYKHWQNELPLEYYCQVQHNMFVCDCKKALFICLVLDDRNYFEIEVQFDADFVEKQNAYLVDWWNRYIIGDEVPIKVVDDYEKENPERKIIEANDEILQKYTELTIVKAEYKALAEKKEVLEDDLKTFIGSNTDLMNGLNVIATWRPQTKVLMDTKKFKEEMPETFLKYAKESSTRVFLIKL